MAIVGLAGNESRRTTLSQRGPKTYNSESAVHQQYANGKVSPVQCMVTRFSSKEGKKEGLARVEYLMQLWSLEKMCTLQGKEPIIIRKCKARSSMKGRAL